MSNTHCDMQSTIVCLFSPAVKFVIPWAEMTRLERVSTGLMTEAIRVSTRQRQREFSMFLNRDEAFGVIGQLADIALRRLLDSEGLELDRVLQQPTRITKRSVKSNHGFGELWQPQQTARLIYPYTNSKRELLRAVEPWLLSLYSTAGHWWCELSVIVGFNKTQFPLIWWRKDACGAENLWSC